MRPNKRLLRMAAQQRQELKEFRLRAGQAHVMVVDTTTRLRKNVGRWHRIYYGRCRPSYLYSYNKGKELLDYRITMRGVARCLRGEVPYYYAMILPAGIQGEFVL